MLKSPEEYLAGLEFDAGDQALEAVSLTGSERAFVEKYLGLDALARMPAQDPEPVPLLQAIKESQGAKLPFAEPEIVVVGQKSAAPVAPEAAPVEKDIERSRVKLLTTLALPDVGARGPLPVLLAERPPVLQRQIVTVAEEVTAAIAVRAEAKVEQKCAVEADAAQAVKVRQAAGEVQKLAVKARAAIRERVAERARLREKARAEAALAEEVAVAAPTEDKVAAEAALETEAPVGAPQQDVVQDVALDEAALEEKTEVVAESAVTASAALLAQSLSAEALLKERLKAEAEVLVVSFFISDQTFLLPVIGIREVLRHMELIKVPHAPAYVAGAINLRGRVTPIVHLSALLTNGSVEPYDERKFIIIAGTDALQLGLIIDKVSSMHLVPQNKIIWNPESKLADAAEFLNAIVTLDDRVCGMVSPEMITRLILPELGAGKALRA